MDGLPFRPGSNREKCELIQNEENLKIPHKLDQCATTSLHLLIFLLNLFFLLTSILHHAAASILSSCIFV